MSSYDDDFSEASFDESAFNKDEPPTLDETLFDISLYSLFNNFMMSQQASYDLLFIKQSRLLRLFNAPRSIFLPQAIKMIWTFFSECAPMPVQSVSPEVKKKLQELTFDPDQEATLDKDSFSVAFGEVYNAVVPHFHEWIATGEWRDAIPFHRLPPPTFNVVLTSRTLRFLFNKHIKPLRKGDDKASHFYRLWKFCVIANDFRDGKFTHSLEGRKKSKKTKTESADGDTSDSGDLMSPVLEPADKIPAQEDYANRIREKYHKDLTLPFKKVEPCSLYIIRSLNQAIEEFDKSEVFYSWLKLKQYQSVDYQAKVVHQTLTKDGYVEPPTLAAGLTSSILPFFLVMMNGIEAGHNLEFLVDVLKFRHRFDFEKDRSTTSASSSTSTSAQTATDHKEMVEEARRIFAKYLEKGDMYCDPHLVEEVRSVINSRGGKGVTCTTFRKCGAFIYQRSEHSWARQARATILWTNKSYDNRCTAARAVEEEFSLSVLPEGIDLQIVPTVDDTLANQELVRDFAKFVGEEIYSAFMRYRAAFEEYTKTPAAKRKPVLDNLCKALGDVAALFPTLQPLHQLVVREASQRERLADSLFPFVSSSVVRTITKKTYPEWLVKNSMSWKTIPWSPVQTILYSDMTGAYDLTSVEKKIKEAALKGKSGIARLLAKRAVKKQSIANVRSTHGAAKPIGELSTNVFSSTDSDLLAFATPQENPVFKIEGVTTGEGVKRDEDIFTVPPIADTLSSSYLRVKFGALTLHSVLSVSEFALWNALTHFFNKYSSTDDEKMESAQSEMKKDIDQICDDHNSILPNAIQLKQRAKKQKVLSPQFFRSSEIELYSKHYKAFEHTLHEKGWK